MLRDELAWLGWMDGMGWDGMGKKWPSGRVLWTCSRLDRLHSFYLEELSRLWNFFLPLPFEGICKNDKFLRLD